MTREEVSKMVMQYRQDPEALWDGRLVMELLVHLHKKNGQIDGLQAEIERLSTCSGDCNNPDCRKMPTETTAENGADGT